MPVLIVAAGGGGDAITASALARILDPDPPEALRAPVVMTYSWDRLMIDPLPGPRTSDDFTGLTPLHEIIASTRCRPPAHSSLPRLAAELPARLLLLDPTDGAVGLAGQIAGAATELGCDEIALVDVGGDIVTVGAADPGLRSPLADQLALAACVRTGMLTRVIVAGPGLDGEIPGGTVVGRLRALDATDLRAATAADVASVRPVFRWHPSEASGLFTAAAEGLRGIVEVRDNGDHVTLDDTTPRIAAVDAARLAATTPARHLTDSTSLDEAETTVRYTAGVSEIDIERRKARAERPPARQPRFDDLAAIDEHAAAAARRGADHITMRRLAELVHARTPETFAGLTQLLAEHRGDRVRPPLYRTR